MLRFFEQLFILPEAIIGLNENTRTNHSLVDSPNAHLDKTILTKYLDLPIPDNKVLATYIWIDGTGENLRCKDRTLDLVPHAIKDLPEWNYDGSSTGQATGTNSDTYLHPQAMYRDPFLRGNHVLVMCDTYDYKKQPTESNKRHRCAEAHQLCMGQEPWFGIEQEYTLLDCALRPYGWPRGGEPPAQGRHYCGVGADRVYARDLIQAHYLCCLYAGVSICGTNAEVTPSQWEYQVGPAPGVKAADDLWVSRFLLQRLAEEYGLVATLDPKPVSGWNGSGAHTNFSTNRMRKNNGIVEIERAIDKLAKAHQRHIRVYDPKGGKDNEKRLTGNFETSSINHFTSGVANRACSVRIPRSVAEDKKGYLEDRRPASNCDPYAVIDAILRTVCLDE